MTMKKIILCFMLVFSVLFSEAREIININNGWRFSKDATFLSHSTTIDLPHTWNSEINRNGHGSDYYFGTGSYLKQINIPISWADGKRIYIKFKGVSSVATLFINGKYVGNHKGAFTAFTFEISQFLNYGTSNSILVVANNSTNMDVMPLGMDKTVFGGIYRDVELVVVGGNHIALSDYSSDGVYVKQLNVTKEVADLEVDVKLDGRIGSQVGVRVDVKNGEEYVTGGEAMATIETNGRSEIIIPLTITNPRLWNGVYDPFMYSVTVSLTDNLGENDVITLPLGLRFYSIDRDKGFFLNGEPYKLKGVNYYQDRSGVGSAMTKGHYEEDINMIVEMGATAVRMAGAPHDRYVYELCDKEGLIVWSDLPFTSHTIHGGKGFLDSYDFRSNGENQLTEMIRQNYNNPSVIFWGLFDKITTKGDDCRPYIEMLNDVAHNESPDRLTVGTSNEDGGINKITDLISWAQYFGWDTGLPADFNRWTDQFKKGWADLKPAVGEYGAGGNIFHQSDSLKKPDITGGLHPENWQSYVHEQHIASITPKEYLWGAFVNSMFDYSNHYMPNGVFDFGLITQDRHIKKDAYYIYKANWNTTEPFVYITERRNLQRPTPKQNIKVYTNLVEVELFVNGVSIGTKQVKDGVVKWDNITLKSGNNVIEARSGRVSDSSNIEIVKVM